MPRDRRRQSRPPLIPELNLTPLIDVALTLLVIFMVTAPMVQNNIKVLLPSGKSKELTQQQEAVLTITAEKNFYFNSYPVKQEDIIAVVKNTTFLEQDLGTIGYTYKGEFNIPFQYGFSKRDTFPEVNLHVYEEGNPEIEINLLFRDYLRNHPRALKEYADLKLYLVS